MASLVGAKRTIAGSELAALLKSDETFVTAEVNAKNGVFTLRRNGVMDFVERANVPPPVYTEVTEAQMGMHLRIPKIPFSIFNHIFAFTRAVYKKDHTESTLMVFYNKEKNLFYSWAPLQTNSGANSKYKRDEDPAFVEMEKENLLVMVAHSHPWGGTVNGKPGSPPGPSGTDEADEKDAILYMILGSVESKYPAYRLSTCANGHRHFLKIEDVFEMNIPANPNLPENYRNALNQLSAEQKVELLADPDYFKVPESFMNRCTKEVYVAKSSGYPYGGAYGSGYDGYGYGRNRSSYGSGYGKGGTWNSSYTFLDSLTVQEESAVVLTETMLGELPELVDCRKSAFQYSLSLSLEEIQMYIKELEVDGRTAVDRFRDALESFSEKTGPTDEPGSDAGKTVQVGGSVDGNDPGSETGSGTGTEGSNPPEGTGANLDAGLGNHDGGGLAGSHGTVNVPASSGHGHSGSGTTGSDQLPQSTAGTLPQGEVPTGQKASLKLVLPSATLAKTPSDPVATAITPTVHNPSLLPVVPGGNPSLHHYLN